MTEYSPLPGTLRSNAREVTDEPCTKNTTGRDGSPAFGAPIRLRNIQSGTSPFLAQYSLLQISRTWRPLAGRATADGSSRQAKPGGLMTARRAVNRTLSVMVVSPESDHFGRADRLGEV